MMYFEVKDLAAANVIKCACRGTCFFLNCMAGGSLRGLPVKHHMMHHSLIG
eukprot:jgi/Botrbrau1/4980/Bobra.0396s0008.1